MFVSSYKARDETLRMGFICRRQFSDQQFSFYRSDVGYEWQEYGGLKIWGLQSKFINSSEFCTEISFSFIRMKNAEFSNDTIQAGLIVNFSLSFTV